jgi:hypothetical protein
LEFHLDIVASGRLRRIARKRPALLQARRAGGGDALQPAYEISNLRFGIEAPDEQWSAEAYFANLFDRNAVIFTNTGNYDHRETTNEPCVFGIRLSYGFGKKG